MNWYKIATLAAKRETQIQKLMSGQSFIGYRGAPEAIEKPTAPNLGEDVYEGFYVALLPEYADVYGPIISQYKIPPQKVLSSEGRGEALYREYIKTLMDRNDPYLWRLSMFTQEEIEKTFSPEERDVNNDAFFFECFGGLALFLMGPFPEFLNMAKQEGFTCTFDGSEEVFLLYPDTAEYIGTYEDPLSEYTTRNSI